MSYNAPPWPPTMDQDAVWFMERLRNEKYPGGIDNLGNIRWPSDWRMHMGNGCDRAEAARRCFVNIDEIRAGQPITIWPAGQYDVPWAPGLDQDADDFFSRLDALYQEHQSRPVDDLGICRWSSDYRIARGNGLSHEWAWEKIKREILDIWGVVPPAGDECPVPIRGQLRRQGNLLVDDGGFVTPIFSSEFNLLRILKLDPAMYDRLKSDLIRYRLQGSRIFTNVGGWMGFWAPHSGVYPISFTPWEFDRKDGHLRPATDPAGNPRYGARIEGWPDYDDLLYRACEDFARARLAFHFTTGDCQIIYCDIGSNNQPVYNFDRELEHHRRVARIIKSVDVRLAALYEIRNEYPMNSPYGGSSQDRDNMGRIIREVKSVLGSSVLCGLGACLSEEPNELLESVEHSDVCFAHTTRSPFELCLKRTMALVYWEGDWRHFDWPYVQGEPKPMDIPPFGDGVGDDGYAPTQDVAELIALHAAIAATAQGGNLFTGASVRLQTYPSLMPGYREIPAIIEREIPEDIATWAREVNVPAKAILYFTKGDRFVAPTYSGWPTNPPRPVAEWTMYTGTGTQMETISGLGAPPQGRTGFIVGRFQ